MRAEKEELIEGFLIAHGAPADKDDFALAWQKGKERFDALENPLRAVEHGAAVKASDLLLEKGVMGTAQNHGAHLFVG